MTKRTPIPSGNDKSDSRSKYSGLHGKVVNWVEHTFEDGRLYLSVRFTNHTELCWQITTKFTIEQGDLSHWESGDFTQLGVFVENERGKNT